MVLLSLLSVERRSVRLGQPSMMSTASITVIWLLSPTGMGLQKTRKRPAFSNAFDLPSMAEKESQDVGEVSSKSVLVRN